MTQPIDGGRETLPEALRVLAVAPRYDSAGKHDATGAFIPEAHRFLALHQAEDKVRLFDNTKPPSARRREVCELLEGLPAGSFDLAAFFCHGYPRGLQTGHTITELAELADDLARILRTGGSVALYACSAGEDVFKATADHLEEGPGGDGGFADSLRLQNATSPIPGAGLISDLDPYAAGRCRSVRNTRAELSTTSARVSIWMGFRSSPLAPAR